MRSIWFLALRGLLLMAALWGLCCQQLRASAQPAGPSGLTLTCAAPTSGPVTVSTAGYLRSADGDIDLPLNVQDANGPVRQVTLTAPGAEWLVAASSSRHSVGGERFRAEPVAPGVLQLTLDTPSAAGVHQFDLHVRHLNVYAPLLVAVSDGTSSVHLLLSLAHPLCNRTPSRPPAVPPEPPDPADPPWLPTYQAHVVLDEDFARPWTAADRQSLWPAGLPVPDRAETPINVFAGGGVDAAAAPAAPAGSGWQVVYRQAYNPLRPERGREGGCRLLTLADGPQRGWMIDASRSWPGGAGALHPRGNRNAPAAGYHVQWVCVLDGMHSAQNLMVQFALTLAGSDPGATFFVGVSTDGQHFLGRRWQRSYRSPNGVVGWSDQRLFVPFIGAAAAGSGGRAAVLLDFRTTSPVADSDLWLSALRIERYDPPPTACRTVDPSTAVAGTPGNIPVSKGLNFPPYPSASASGLAGDMERLRAAGVEWVRLEMEGPVHLAPPANTLIGAGGRLIYLDLRHYDDLLQLLCAGDQPIATLGLLDYRMLPSLAWRSGVLGDDYVQGFTAMTRLLVRYYQDRMRSWEVWNEPDYRDSRLRPADYARLLAASYATIKQIDPGAQVVFGGLGGVDWVAANYFQQVLQALPPGPAPYDIFAIHPYPSKEFRRNGQIIRDPSYLTARQPTALAPFMALMRRYGQANRPIWITELGWNRAGDSANPATRSCMRIYETMVTGPEQALFLPIQFDILFKDTAWAAAIPSVQKVFWYQYADVGVSMSESECRGNRQGAGARIVDWWYGLYSGTDPANGIVEPQPNLAACTFRAYPEAAAVNACLRGAALSVAYEP